MKCLAPMVIAFAACAASPVLAQTADPALVESRARPLDISAALEDAVEAHLKAVVERDLAALEPTLTAGETLTLIFPNGRRTETRQAFIDFHRDWFAKTNWTMAFEPVSVTETADMAVILVRTRYEETDEDGAGSWSESWLTLTFAREAHGWALVHDQNTSIRTSSDPAS